MATTKYVESVVDNKGKTREVEVFVFHNPAKRKRESKNEEKPDTPQKVNLPSLKLKNLKKKRLDPSAMSVDSVRKDVHTLGITGMVGRTKIEAQLARLKSLGAEIPKNWERRMDRRRRNEEYQRRRQDIKAGMKGKKAVNPKKSVQRSQSQKSKKNKEDGVFFDGQVGKYKDGVQYISAADIKRISSGGKNSTSR